MTRVGIMTFHAAHNYGSILQAQALFHALKHYWSVDPVIIDYTPASIIFSDLISNVGRLPMRYKSFANMLDDFFVEHKTARTHKISFVNMLNESFPSLDLCFFGGDQIWNPFITIGVNPMYFGSFLDKQCLKISYSASFGTKILPVIFRNSFRRWLNNLDSISVRENSSTEFIETITGQRPTICVDPVFLLSKNDWDMYTETLEDNGTYVFLYMIQNDPQLIKEAISLKLQFGCKIVALSKYNAHYSSINEYLDVVPPGKFLSYVKNARCVITNSYHGLCFSIIFKKLCFVRRSRLWQIRHFNLIEMLKLYPKASFELTRNNNVFDYCYDFNQCDMLLLENEINKSLDYISQALQLVDAKKRRR